MIGELVCENPGSMEKPLVTVGAICNLPKQQSLQTCTMYVDTKKGV